MEVSLDNICQSEKLFMEMGNALLASAAISMTNDVIFTGALDADFLHIQVRTE